MPYPPHYLLAWGGDFSSDPGEMWNNNLRLAVDDNVDLATHTSLDDGAMSSALDGLVTKIQTHISTVTSGYGSNARLTYVKLNEIDSTGLYKNKTDSNTRFLGSPYTSGGSSTALPLTSSLVVTFLTSADRGPGSRGRVYVPQPAVALNSAGKYRITQAVAEGFMTQWRTFLDGIEIGVPGSPIVPSVVSDRGPSGVARTINRVQVGDIIDHMGSRRNRLKETRYTSPTFN